MKEGALPIRPETTLAQIIRDYPQTVQVMNELNLDYCCNGGDSLFKATSDKGIDTQRFIQRLQEEARRPLADEPHSLGVEEFAALSPLAMMDSIEGTHHMDERVMWQKLDQQVNKILRVHYTHHGDELVLVHRLFSELKMELEAHFALEEEVAFPMFAHYPVPGEDQRAMIARLEKEHEAVGSLIKRLQEATNGFTPPEDACATYRMTYDNLKAFTQDIFLHVFKENAILFPEYLEQAK